MTDREYIKAFFDEYVAQLNRGGPESLDRLQRTYCCVSAFQTEVTNGGLHTFLFNSSGQFAKETPTVLSEIGAPEAASILSELNAMVGPDGPAIDRRLRSAQLDRLTPQQEQRVEELTNAYFDDERGRRSLHHLFEAYLLARRPGDAR